MKPQAGALPAETEGDGHAQGRDFHFSPVGGPLRRWRARGQDAERGLDVPPGDAKAENARGRAGRRVHSPPPASSDRRSRAGGDGGDARADVVTGGGVEGAAAAVYGGGGDGANDSLPVPPSCAKNR